MLEKYYKYKSAYSNYLIFIKVGSFYECFSKDALIINKLFNYKIKKISSTFKCGFPINNIEYVISKLKQNNINYIILEDDITDKYETDSNTYSNYNFDTDSLLYSFILIEKIIKYLENNITNDEISNKITEIAKLLDI